MKKQAIITGMVLFLSACAPKIDLDLALLNEAMEKCNVKHDQFYDYNEQLKEIEEALTKCENSLADKERVAKRVKKIRLSN